MMLMNLLMVAFLCFVLIKAPALSPLHVISKQASVTLTPAPPATIQTHGRGERQIRLETVCQLSL